MVALEEVDLLEEALDHLVVALEEVDPLEEALDRLGVALEEVGLLEAALDRLVVVLGAVALPISLVSVDRMKTPRTKMDIVSKQY